MLKGGSIFVLSILLFWSCGRPFGVRSNVGLIAEAVPKGSAFNQPGSSEAARRNDPLVFTDRGWVYYLAPRSTTPRRLAEGNFPALDPAGNRVIYCTTNDPEEAEPFSQLMLFDLATDQTVIVHQARSWIGNPRWSPVDELIAFTVANPDGKLTLFTIWPDGSHKTKLVSADEQGFGTIFNPVWAPDGESILFQDMQNLVRISMAGRAIEFHPLPEFTGSSRVITSTDVYAPNPQDDNLLAFTESVPGTALFEKMFGEPNTALFIYDWRTQTSTRVTPGDILAIDPIWSRDGQYLYFSGYRDRDGRADYPFKIYRIGRDGTGLTVIANGENPQT